MQVSSAENQTCELRLEREEIRILHQALNEVCHGVHISDLEFPTRMGTDRKTAQDLMKQLASAYELTTKE